ncbi:MAG: hypothetical protein A2Z64_10550 [Betaproteobacteria bacterium RIFCSPLOWO2_02_67_12]|nr:MAG: hypothetical protein A2Z64_10550 [Betaproteobacteria bacterium RIFCSPLOWO2_02_67_12]OGA31145.1 MAG: hypothetical protein A3I65_09390 [Betaproteobacteria bacterium RIFCSPLOWO2_02_FULL_68_150]OGA70499.1 MAG: hypothetical protein A3F77_08075 [Betaproteobacteria bacterium RIFCSPLOWO2_12_FULL_67_28]
MQGFYKILILLLMLAAVPLRAYAAIEAGLCDAHDGGLPAVQATAHHHASDRGDDSQTYRAQSSGIASVCSLCTTCSVGAPLAPTVVQTVAFAAARASAIPFFGFGASGHVPDILDRPPLAL